MTHPWLFQNCTWALVGLFKIPSTLVQRCPEEGDAASQGRWNLLSRDRALANSFEMIVMLPQEPVTVTLTF